MRLGQKQMVMALAVLVGLSVSATAKHKTRSLKFKGSTAVASGFVGGENIDTYWFHANKGQVESVKFRTTDAKPNFTISGPGKNPQVEFGQMGGDGLSWNGKIEKAGEYSIDVTSNPETSHYTLTVVREKAKPSQHGK